MSGGVSEGSLLGKEVTVLHMIVNSHNAESCPFRSSADADALVPALERLDETLAGRGASMLGAWVNSASHTSFILVDATNAHVVDEAIGEAGLTGRTHSRVFAVSELPAVLERIRRQRRGAGTEDATSAG